MLLKGVPCAVLTVQKKIMKLAKVGEKDGFKETNWNIQLKAGGVTINVSRGYHETYWGDTMDRDLHLWLEEYNNQRTHSGKYCYGRTPMQTFLETLPLAKQKMLQDVPPAA